MAQETLEQAKSWDVVDLIPETERGALPEAVDIYLDQVAQIPMLTKAEQTEAINQHLSGDPAARQKLIESNLRLVISIARLPKYRNRGLEFIERIQEGNTGLAEAIDRFDPTEASLSTYATLWIHRNIALALHNQGRAIRYPREVSEAVSKINAVTNRLLTENGREASPQEIAAEMGMSVEEIEDLFNLPTAQTIFDAPDDHKKVTFGETLHDESNAYTQVIDDIAAQASKSTLKSVMAYRQKVDILSDDQVRILRLRFGLEPGTEPLTPPKIAKIMKRAPETIRRLENEALMALAASATLREVTLDDDFESEVKDEPVLALAA